MISLNDKVLGVLHSRGITPQQAADKFVTVQVGNNPETISVWDAESLGVQPTTEELEQHSNAYLNEVKAEEVRTERDLLLAETDWWASSDLTMTSEQTAYRQALRDVPSQEGFPESITWPTKP